MATRAEIRHLASVKRGARERARAYFRELDGSVLSEEDAIGASLHAEAVLIEHTQLSPNRCRDIALDIAFEVKPEFDRKEAA